MSTQQQQLTNTLSDSQAQQILNEENKAKKKKYRTILGVLGTIEACVGFLCVIAGIVLLKNVGTNPFHQERQVYNYFPNIPKNMMFYTKYIRRLSFGEGLWCGFWLIAAGLSGIFTKLKNSSSYWVNLHMGLSILASIFSIILIVVASVSLANANSYVFSDDSFQNYLFPFWKMEFCLGVICLILHVTSAGCCSGAGGCCRTTYKTMPGYLMPATSYRQQTVINHSNQPGVLTYPIQQAAYPTQQAAYPTQQAAYPTQQAAYSTQQAAYPAQQEAYPAQQAAYPTQQAAYPFQQAAYPFQQAAYPFQQAAYSTQQAAYPAQQEAYPAQQAAYPAQQEAYPAQQAAYPAQQEAYPAQQEAYPAQQEAYPAQQEAYPAQQEAYPAQQEAYPTQNYPQTTVINSTPSQISTDP